MYTFTVTATGTKRVRINDDAPTDVRLGSDPNHLTIGKLADKPAGTIWEIDLDVNDNRRQIRDIRSVEESTNAKDTDESATTEEISGVFVESKRKPKTVKPQTRAGPKPKAVDVGTRETVNEIDEPKVLVPDTGKTSAAETHTFPGGLTAVFDTFSIEEILDQYVWYKFRQIISDLERTPKIPRRTK